MPGALAETNVVANMLFLSHQRLPARRQRCISGGTIGPLEGKRVIQIIWRLSILHPHPWEC